MRSYTRRPKTYCREFHTNRTCGKIRLVVNKLLDHGYVSPGKGRGIPSRGDGIQSQIARHFVVSRQRVHQIIKEEIATRALLSSDNT